MIDMTLMVGLCRQFYNERCRALKVFKKKKRSSMVRLVCCASSGVAHSVRLTALVCVSKCIYLLMPEFNKGRLFVKNVRKCVISISLDIDSVGLGSGSDNIF